MVAGLSVNEGVLVGNIIESHDIIIKQGDEYV